MNKPKQSSSNKKKKKKGTQKQELSFSHFLLLRLKFEKREPGLSGPAMRRARSQCDKLGFSANAAEWQRRTSLKILTLVPQEVSWGRKGIEKGAAAEALSLHFFSLWEKAAHFRVWTKHKEPSPCRLQGNASQQRPQMFPSRLPSAFPSHFWVMVVLGKTEMIAVSP